jgi:hypothetical protein
MDKPSSHRKEYLLAAALGALGGGLIVLWATKAIPKMMSQMMAGMMQKMMSQMRKGGCAPPDM